MSTGKVGIDTDSCHHCIFLQAESAAIQLGATSKTVGSAMAQLLTAAAQGNEDYVGIAARDTANALKVSFVATHY